MFLVLELSWEMTWHYWLSVLRVLHVPAMQTIQNRLAALCCIQTGTSQVFGMASTLLRMRVPPLFAEKEVP